MGGVPKLALNVVAFPNCLGPEVLEEILRGGADKVMEAGAVLAGDIRSMTKNRNTVSASPVLYTQIKCGKTMAPRQEIFDSYQAIRMWNPQYCHQSRDGLPGRN